MNPNIIWKTPPTALSLTDNNVQVWRVALDKPTLSLSQLSALLSADERASADRYHFERDRRRYVVGRATLRLILGQYLRLEPQQIIIGYGPYGKPRLEMTRSLNLHFNLAHSNELALYAFTHDRPIGIDLEYSRRIVDSEQLVAHFFSDAEIAIFRETSPEQQQERFFQLWTQKEAYLKAVGIGLLQPLNSFSVLSAGSCGIEFVSSLNSVDETSTTSWSLKILQPTHDYIAALAVEGNDLDLDSNVVYWKF